MRGLELSLELESLQEVKTLVRAIFSFSDNVTDYEGVSLLVSDEKPDYCSLYYSLIDKLDDIQRLSTKAQSLIEDIVEEKKEETLIAIRNEKTPATEK
jgi:hypothetical protein